LQTAARGTARTLGLIPPFVIALLSGKAARDAVWAASYTPDGPILSPSMLLVFGVISLFGGLFFLWGRERASQKKREQYFNDPSLGPDWMATIAAEKYHFIWSGGPGPTWLALLALIAAVLARCVFALVPTHVSLAVGVIILMLSAWLGFLGWLSLKERQEARPLVTVVNVGGTGGSGRRAEAMLQTACEQFPQPLSQTGAQQPCAIQVAQRTDGILYPLGWYLSPTARRALDRKAACEVRVQVLGLSCPTDSEAASLKRYISFESGSGQDRNR
jgi:hypothetical protein